LYNSLSSMPCSWSAAIQRHQGRMIRLDVTTQDSRDSDAMLEDSRRLTS